MRLATRLILALSPLATLAGMPLAPPVHAQATTAARAPAKPFVSAAIAKDAERYEGQIKAAHKPGKAKAAELRVAGEKSLATDPRAAAAQYSLAAVTDPRDAEAWIGLARALLATKPVAENSAERYTLPMNAAAAAYTAYQRSPVPAVKARALAVLGDALKRRSQWRPAIEALRSSLALADNAQVRKDYDALRSEHGFRITEHKLDVDGAQPRICVLFSEPLARGNVEWTKFLSIDGKDPQSVSADTKQLCIEGLKHGSRYLVQVRAGLPSEVGEQLEKTAEIKTFVRDRAASVRFAGRSYVLPSRGQQGIPVVSINADKADVEIYRIGDRSLAGAVQNGDLQKQLSSYELGELRDRTGQRVFKGGLDIASKLNEEVTTAFPVSEAIPRLEPGVYAMVARSADKRSDDDNGWATQWFVVSDLGLTAMSAGDGIHAFVRSLATADVAGGATVRLIARNNEVLATVRADANGYARFDGGLRRGEGGLAPAILVAEAGSGDYAFLDLTAAAFDLTDRGVKGREAAGALEGFVFAERGVYRPGEDVHLTALLRDKAAKAATVPLTLIVTRPDGVEHRRLALTDQGLGGRLTTLALSGGAMTGTWRAKLYTDPKANPLAQTSFLVEDFTPERLDLRLDAAGTVIGIDAPATIAVAGRYLYGPPAAGLAIEGDVVVKPSTKDLAGFAGYRFGQSDEKVTPVRKPLEGLPATGADGNAQLRIALPAVNKTARPLETDLMIRLRESGGRTIEQTLTIPVDLKLARIGIKPGFGSEGPSEGEAAIFDIVALDAAGKAAAGRELHWKLMRLDTTWQWFKQDGRWSWESATSKRLITSGKVMTAADTPARVTARVDYGRFQLEVTDPAAAGATAASINFNAGWHTATDEVESPEHLEVALDKPSYKPGETARLRISTKQGGKALVSVLANGLLTARQVEVAAGRTDVHIEVGEWGAGAYATAVLYRAMDEKAKRMPSRALGVAWLGLDQAPRTLSVALNLPDKIKSSGVLSVPVKIGGLAAGEEARITVAAVDAGILNLTRYQPPQPEKFFYAQRQMGVDIRDYYGRLIDGMRAERGRLRSGGDAAGGMAMQGSPPVERLVALHSGIVKVGADGTARIDFQLPDFNGAVRVMGVAWSGDKLGSASSDVIVRDPIALIASGPRFMTLGDDVRLELDLHNVEGSDAAYKVAIEQDVGGTRSSVLARDVQLKANERRQERLTVKPADVGLVKYNVAVTGPGGIDVRRELTFDVKVPAGDIRRTTVSQLAAKGGRITLTQDLSADLIPSRTRIALSVGPHAALDVPGLLAALDRYPYGCAEQTVSRALPLLYANAVASRVGIAADAEIKTRVAKAVDRVLEMQDASGAFGIWGPYNADLWLTSYVTDFLTRAKEAGVSVRQQPFTQALDRLQSYVSYAQDFEKGGEARAYAMYVLARNGRAPIGELRYFADARLDRLATPLAQAHLGAALAMAGDKARAETVFRAAISSLAATGDDAMRQDYGSKLRDSAALVTLASETSTLKSEAPRLVSVIAEAYRARTYTSTQEQAWMLLAANALADAARETALTVAGQAHKGPYYRALTAAELKSGAISISNDGDAPVSAVISVTGSALTAEPPASKGFTIERSAYTLEGKAVDLKSLSGGQSRLKQNDRLVMVLKVEAKQTGGRILLVDRLPAGLEIENPRLVDGGDIKSLEWLKTTAKPEHTEFRDDRFVAAFNFFGGNVQSRRRGGDDDDDDEAKKEPVSQATVAYIVRAVTPGTFIHPAATVEDMYRPERYARTASGQLEVTGKE
jgi:uncharacterized protein YfaS (alpha-2-macroglobulin family)